MKLSLLFFALLLTMRVSAQLVVGSSGVNVLAGTSLTVGGITLTPSTTVALVNNGIQRTSTSLAGNSSINRLYQFKAPLLFSGKVGISYLPAELNGYKESTLQLAYAPSANTNLTVTTSSTVNLATHLVQNTLASQNLFVVTATALSDLTPTLYARPSLLYPNSPFSIVVDVEEINSVATQGTFRVRVTKDPSITLTFEAGLTSINGRAVQNSAWGFDDSDLNYYVLSTSQSIAAENTLSFGLTGTLTGKATSGVITVSSTVLPINLLEAKMSNNMDADKVEYFQP